MIMLEQGNNGNNLYYIFFGLLDLKRIFFFLRYFKKENLPRIIYNNPGLPIEVSVLKEKGVKPTLTIEFGIVIDI